MDMDVSGMTAPTPEKIEALGYAAAENIERGYPNVPLANNEDTLWLVNSLEEVKTLLDQTLVERDYLLKTLAEAPHMDYCQYSYLSGYENIRCTCWKAEI